MSSTLLPNFLQSAALAAPARTALRFGSAHWTYQDLERAVAAVAPRLSGALTTTGASRRIGILSANRPGLVFALHAAPRIGATLVPLNWRLSAEELRWQITDAQIDLLLIDEAREEVARAACRNLSVRLIPIADLEWQPENVTTQATAAPIDLSAEALIIYTSGTTGRPKGARLTYGNLWFSAIASSLHIGHHHDDVWLAVLPLFHIGGLSILYRGVIGATQVELHDQFDPHRVCAALASDITLASLVPTMLERLLDEGLVTPPRLRCVLIGGGSAPTELIARSARLGIPVSPTYGLTETASQAATLLPEDVLRKPGSSGQPLPITEVRIVEGARIAGPGQIGAIEVRGPNLFAGYLGLPAWRHESDDDWFSTGDDGYLDEDGFLYVVDRRQDMIVSGGENIYPAEVERILLQHPDVADAGVVGVPSPTWGARPVAAIVWRGPKESVLEPILLAHCRAHLAAYKVPDRIIRVSALPRTSSGKLLRRSLREMLTVQES